MKIKTLTFLLLLTQIKTFFGEEICCCPDLSVSLRCEDRSSESTKTSILKANGYICDALDGTDVALTCGVTDISEAVKTVRYSYYKAKDLAFKPVAYDVNNSKKLTHCDATKDTCVLPSVKWSGEADSPTKFNNFDNYFYQCTVEITLIDGTVLELTSNTMLLDIYKNEVVQENFEILKEDKVPLSTNNAYERLTCGIDNLPLTNPRTRAKWSFKRLEESEWTELEILPDKPRMALVEPTIATESAGSFAEGTLVLMLFDPVRDTGYYRCEAEYKTLTVGNNQTYTRAEYKISGNGQIDQSKRETKILSTVTSTAYTLRNEFVYFSCHARDTDASKPGKFRWVYEDGTEFADVDVSSDLFRDVEILNYNRTLKVPSYYKYYDLKFRCEVRGESGSSPVLSNQFTQPLIVPQEMYVPLTSKTCSNIDADIDLFASTKYMMSDKTDVDDSIQKLTGASYRWMINSNIITPFSNPSNTGGITTEQRLKMAVEVFNRTVGDARNAKCQYFTFLQTRSKGYQLHEVLKVTRSISSCQDFTNCSAVTVTQNCRDSSLTVSLGVGSPQCIFVEVLKEKKSLLKKVFSRVAPSCSERSLEMVITKEELQVDKIEGKFEVQIGPEGKKGCSKIIDLDAEAAYCINEQPTAETSTMYGNIPGPKEVVSCPPEYKDDASKTPWTINTTGVTSNTCEIKVSHLDKLGIRPAEGFCYEISLVSSQLEFHSKSICESELPLANLSRDSNYDLRWRGYSNQSENESDCRSKIRVQCSSSKTYLTYSKFLLTVIFLGAFTPG
ncbi:hypothetical protein ACHWQZ_G003848 [Mnemiopsis leidyi]